MVDYWLAAFVMWGLVVILGLQLSLVVESYSRELPKPALGVQFRLSALVLALISQWGVLYLFQWFEGWERPLVQWGEWAPSAHDLLFVLGGAFLFFRASLELFWPKELRIRSRKNEYSSLLHIAKGLLLTLGVYALDGALLATALESSPWLSVGLLGSAMLVVVFAQAPLVRILSQEPSLQTLTHAFIVVLALGFAAQGLHLFDNLNWLYPMLCFALAVEFLNMRRRHREQIRRNLEEIE